MCRRPLRRACTGRGSDPLPPRTGVRPVAALALLVLSLSATPGGLLGVAAAADTSPTTTAADLGVSGNAYDDEAQRYADLSSYWSLLRLEKRVWEIQRRVNIFVSRRRLLLDRWILDRVVRDPTKLDPRTHFALERVYDDWWSYLVRLRIRYEATNTYSLTPYYRRELEGYSPFGDEVVFSKPGAERALNQLTRMLERGLDDAALWDVGVYALSQLTGLATDWDQVMTGLLRSEWTAATTVLLVSSLSNNGRVGTVVRLWEDESGWRKIGFRGELSKFGVSLKPRLSLGLVYETPEYVSGLELRQEWADLKGRRIRRGTLNLRLARDRSFAGGPGDIYVAQLLWRIDLLMALEPLTPQTPWRFAQVHQLDYLIHNRLTGSSPRLTVQFRTADERITSLLVRVGLTGHWTAPFPIPLPEPDVINVFLEVGFGQGLLLDPGDESEWHIFNGLALAF